MDDSAVMRTIQSRKKLVSEYTHNKIRKHLVVGLYSEGLQLLPHDLEDETHMVAVRSLALKVVKEMANIFVPRVGLV